MASRKRVMTTVKEAYEDLARSESESEDDSKKTLRERTLTWRKCPLAEKFFDDAEKTARAEGLDICEESLVMATRLNIPDDKAKLIDLEWNHSMVDLEMCDQIADGWSGDIMRAANKEKGIVVVLKQFRKRRASELQHSIWVVREVSIHYGLSKSKARVADDVTSQHIVCIDNVVPGPATDHFYLAMEDMPFTLADFLDSCADNNSKPTNGVVKYLFQQIARGLKWMHAHGVMHRDLNPTNILISPNGEAKISDFGEARRHWPGNAAKQYTPNIGTLWYRAPEMLLGSVTYGPAVDIWAAGCILAEMTLLEPLFQTDNLVKTVNLIGTVIGKPSLEDVEAMEKVAPSAIRWKTGGVYSTLPQTGTLYSKVTHYDDVTVEMMKILLAWNPDNRWAGLEIREPEEVDKDSDETKFRHRWHTAIARQFWNPKWAHWGLTDSAMFNKMREKWLNYREEMLKGVRNGRKRQRAERWKAEDSGEQAKQWYDLNGPYEDDSDDDKSRKVNSGGTVPTVVHDQVE